MLGDGLVLPGKREKGEGVWARWDLQGERQGRQVEEQEVRLEWISEKRENQEEPLCEPPHHCFSNPINPCDLSGLWTVFTTKRSLSETKGNYAKLGAGGTRGITIVHTHIHTHLQSKPTYSYIPTYRHTDTHISYITEHILLFIFILLGFNYVRGPTRM